MMRAEPARRGGFATMIRAKFGCHGGETTMMVAPRLRHPGEVRMIRAKLGHHLGFDSGFARVFAQMII
jgi:hypothetical protein